LVSDKRLILYSVQLPTVDVPSTHAVLAGGGAAPPLLPPPHALNSANIALSNSSPNFVRCCIFYLARITGLPVAVGIEYYFFLPRV